MRFCTFLWLLCGLTLATGLSGRAQSTLTRTVEWTGTTQLTNATGKEQRVPTFRGAAYLPGELLGTYTLRVEGRVTEGQLTELQYAPFEVAEAALLAGVTLPGEPAPTLRTGTAMRQAVTFVDFQPFRRNAQTGQPEKLVSFQYTYSAESTGTTARRGQARTHKEASVLRQGTWYKIGVPRNGVYKLDRATLASLGVDVATTDPRRIQLFGNAAGGMLPQLNSAPRPDDLQEIALGFSGNNDAVFSDDEYVVFYSRGPHTWQRDPATNARLFHHTLHLYTDTAYYFVTVGAAAGKRVVTASSTLAPTATITTFAHRDFYEHELVNLAKSGRQWLGEQLGSGATVEIPFSVPNAVPSTVVQLTSSVAATSVAQTNFQLTLNGQAVSTQPVVGLSGNQFLERANTSLTTYSPTIAALAADTRLRYTFAGDVSARGWLDYVELNAQRQLRYVSGQQLDFRSFDNIAPRAASRFTLDNAAGATVWDVTTPGVPAAYSLTNGSFVAPTDTLREFVAFQTANLYTPRLFGRVPNQNLHTLNLDGKLDVVMVTHPLFQAEAERLAAHRRSHDGLTVAVVTTTQVYNEFSSGGQDITAIRDLMKQVYDRAPADKRNFLVLIGDASFDYKSDPTNDLDKVPDWWKSRIYINPSQASQSPSTAVDKINQNYVPVYESVESFAVVSPRPGHEGVTYSSDDYFGLLDDDEGTWNEGFGTTDELMDIGVGRLPVRVQGVTPIAAQTVDKLIAYDAPVAYGKWRNRLTFVSDDGDYNLHDIYSAEPLANSIINTQPAYNVRKVYLDLYQQVSTPSGQLSPDCMQAINNAFEQGSLLVNYSGHGGPSGWADEHILTKSSVANLQNQQRLAFMLTATCDFSTYDDPEFVSAGEEMLTNVSGGAVGLLTTTRLVYSNNNQALAEQFYASVFTPVNGNLPRLGDILTETKNNSIRSVYNRNFSLLGDPSGRLAYPQQTVAIRTVNGHAFTGTPADTLKSLSNISLAGDIRSAGVINTRFNGTAQVTVYDKPTITETLANEPTDAVQPIRVQESVLYDGQATVRNGQFEVQFVVPKDINYSLGLGKISLYASDASSLTDAHGATPATIGSLDTKAPRDTIPPHIALFMDTESFVFGGLTGTSPTLLARLRDASGINTAGSGIGHEITATIDNDPSKLVVLNDFYTAEVDSFQTGRVRYLFKDLSTGPHILRLKAWDTFNNSGEKEIEFIAASTEKLAIQHVLNYPNPFSHATTFHFDQNRTGDDLDVQVQIFTVSGKLVRTLSTTVVGSESHLSALTWDGRDEFNDQLARGVYVYRVSVRSPRDGAAASKFEKLVILN